MVVIAIVWSAETREMTIDANTGPSKLKMGLVLRQKVNHLILRGMIPFSKPLTQVFVACLLRYAMVIVVAFDHLEKPENQWKPQKHPSYNILPNPLIQTEINVFLDLIKFN